MQDSTHRTNLGFFNRASNVNASHSNFTDINVNYNPMNEDACLDKLPRAKQAGYSSKTHRTCLGGTRMKVLEDIEAWEVDKRDKSVYWLRSPAGYGKSTIAQTFAERSADSGRLGASFFCSRDFPDRRNLKLIFPTLAHHLASRFPGFKTALAKIVESNTDVEHDGLTFQLEKLLVRPLKKTGLSCTIIVDALDECEDKEPVSVFLSALAQYVDEIPTIKFFITGRPEDHIRSGFMELRTKELPLHDVESSTVDSDIELYVKNELEGIARRKRQCISGSWPSDKDINAVVEISSGLFIIAFTIIRFVSYRHPTPQERLKRILDMPNTTIYGGSGIDAMYNQILSASFMDVEDSEDDREYFDQLPVVIGSIVLALNPLSRASLAKILKISSENIYNILSCLHSVLIVPDSDSEPIRVCHKSFADFVTNPDRCRDARYTIDAPAQHLKLGGRCMELMKATLTKNICNLPRHSMNKDIENLPLRRDLHIGAPLAYACSSWAKHLWSSSFGTCENTDDIIELVNYFLQKHFLSWLEVLSIEDNFHVSVYALHDAKLWLTDVGNPSSSLFDLIDDCERFVLRFFDVMKESAMHIYHSALPWTPASSVIRRLYQTEFRTEASVLNAVDPTWPACVRIISSQDDINRITFSHTGALIAVCGYDCVTIFDTMTGVKKTTLDMPGSNADFSPDARLVVSTFGYTVRVWDLQTGNLVQMFEDHTSRSLLVSFSPCGIMIASGHDDGTVRVWNMSSGCCQHVLQGHSYWVESVCWSSTGDQVISGSQDGTVRVWNVPNGTCSRILREHIGPVTAVASSPRSFLVASASADGTVKVYDSRTFDVILTIPKDRSATAAEELALPTEGFITSLGFSIGGSEKIIYTSGGAGFIWDISEKKMHVSSITYDGDLAIFSPDGSCVASRSQGHVKIWRQSEGGHQHDGAFVQDVWDLDSAFISKDGQVIASAHKSTVKFWDASTGTCLFTANGLRLHFSLIKSVVFSPNSAFAAFLLDLEVLIFDIHTRVVKSFEMVHPAERQCIAVSSDGSRIASLWNRHLTLWDLRNYRCLASLQSTLPYLGYPWGLAFSLDGNMILIEGYNDIHSWLILPAFSPTHNQADPLPLDLILVSRESSQHHVSSPPLIYHAKDGWITSHERRCMLWVPPDKRYYSQTDSNGKKFVLPTHETVFIFDFSDVLLS